MNTMITRIFTLMSSRTYIKFCLFSVILMMTCIHSYAVKHPVYVYLNSSKRTTLRLDKNNIMKNGDYEKCTGTKNDYNALYDPDTGVLRLRDFHDDQEGWSISTSEGDFTIKVETDSEIGFYDTESEYNEFIRHEGDSLCIELVNGSTLTLQGKGRKICDGIQCFGNVCITTADNKGGKVVINAGAQELIGYATGIVCGKNTYITGSASLEIETFSSKNSTGIDVEYLMIDTTGDISINSKVANGGYSYAVGNNYDIWKSTVKNAGMITLRFVDGVSTMLKKELNSDMLGYEYKCDYADDYYTVVYKKIVPYNLYINDQMVKSTNCSDLSVFNGVSGTVSYDHASKTLSLKDATIINNAVSTGNYDGYGILNGIGGGLTIHLEGENTVTSTQWDGVASISNLNITGDGTLRINADKGVALAMGAEGYRLDIADGAKVYAKGKYGVHGGTETTQVGGTQLTYSYITHLGVSGANTELHVYGTEQCASTIAFLEMDNGMELVFEDGDKAYFQNNSFCFYERRKYIPGSDSWIIVKNPNGVLFGDVNGDGSITMADANMVVNYFLATDPSSIANFNVAAADVNGDKAITMADANQIVNIFLGQ